MTPDAIKTEQLVAYVQGTLPATDAACIDAMLRASVEFQARLATVQKTLNTLQDAEQDAAAWRVDATQKRVLSELFGPRRSDWLRSAAERAREWIAERISVVLPGAGPLPGFRSAATNTHAVYAFDDVEIDLRVTVGDASTGVPGVNLVGLVSSEAPPNCVLLRNLIEATESRLPVEESGEFQGMVPAGIYELRVAFTDRTIVIPRLDWASSDDHDND